MRLCQTIQGCQIVQACKTGQARNLAAATRMAGIWHRLRQKSSLPGASQHLSPSQLEQRGTLHPVLFCGTAPSPASVDVLALAACDELPSFFEGCRLLSPSSSANLGSAQRRRLNPPPPLWDVLTPAMSDLISELGSSSSLSEVLVREVSFAQRRSVLRNPNPSGAKATHGVYRESPVAKVPPPPLCDEPKHWHATCSQWIVTVGPAAHHI